MKAARASAAPDADHDIAKAARAVDAALTAIREAERRVKAAEDRVSNARTVLAQHRLELGKALIKARKLWPASGPKAKGWGDFLRARSLGEDSAREAMEYAGYCEEKFGGKVPPAGELPTRREAGLDDRPLVDPVEALICQARDLGQDAIEKIRAALKGSISGGTGDVDRGTWCTSKRWADAVGAWDLDPFSNPRSHIVATVRCMLEDGGDGLYSKHVPGSHRSSGNKMAPTLRAVESTRVWLQPPYEIVDDVIAHYGHTRFCALLRLDSSTGWFAKLWELTKVIALPKGTREFFEPPPGIKGSTNPQPHALYYADPRDITLAIAEACILLDRYEAARLPALQIVH